MGRLFWKFFFAFMAALLLAGAAVGTVLWLMHPQAAFNQRVERWMAGRMESAMQVMPLLDRDELHNLWRRWQANGEFVPMVVDASGIELLGRPYQAEWLKSGQDVLLSDGSRMRVFAGLPQGGPMAAPRPLHVEPLPVGAGIHPAGAPGPRPPPPQPGLRVPPPPFMEIIVGLLAALTFSVVLAWYLSKPVRHLQQAFDALAEGRLDTRVGARMGRRRDEIADLGRRFDSMADRLQQLMGSQRRLLHDVSHELRSPLARLAAAIGLARQDPQRLEASLDRIERESARLDALVGELLTLSRLEAGAQLGPAADVELTELLSELVADARFEGQAQACSVLLECPPGMVVHGHLELLYRAFDNVLRNALRHSPRHGEIQVLATVDAAGRQISVSIEDVGPGVPEEALERIFEPFQREGSSANGQGFGLGLAIARRAIEAHGGHIRARNRDGAGLAIDITLPLA